jgi:hypothetical protein
LSSLGWSGSVSGKKGFVPFVNKFKPPRKQMVVTRPKITFNAISKILSVSIIN